MELSRGSTTRIFKFECASIVLINDADEDDRRRQSPQFLRVGEFAFDLYAQGVTPIFMTTCSVRDLQWPISKDSTVVRVGRRSFVFVMPHLWYGLQLFPSCREETVDTMESVFMKFADYIKLEGEDGYPCPDDEPTLWSTLRPHIARVARAQLKTLEQVSDGSLSRGQSPVMSSLIKAIRTSAATKIVTNAILAGFLKPMHVCAFGMGVEEAKGKSTVLKVAFASISVITDIVESLKMESEVISTGRRVLPDARRDGQATVPSQSASFKRWRLNEHGASLFLRRC